MTELSSSTFEIELEGPVTPDDPVELELPREGELEVRRVDGTAFMRFNVGASERRRLRSGETICWPSDIGPQVLKVLLDNDGGERAVIEVEKRVGFTIRGFGGSDRGSSVPGPRRLRADLAPGTSIADGDRACEVVDVSEASDRVRVTGQVSGTSALTDGTVLTDPALANGRWVDLRPDGRGAAATDTGTLQLLTVDAAGNMTLQGAVSPAGASRFDVVMIDEDRDLAVAVGDDAGNDLLFVFDVSDRSAPTLEGSVDLGRSGASGSRMVVLARSAGIAWAAAANDLVLVDYGSAPAAPSIVSVFTGRARGGAVGIHEEGGLAVSSSDSTVFGADNLVVWDATDPSTPILLFENVVADDTAELGMSTRQEILVDDPLVVFANDTGGAGDGLNLFDLSNPASPRFLDHSETSFSGTPSLVREYRGEGLLLARQGDNVKLFGYQEGALSFKDQVGTGGDGDGAYAPGVRAGVQPEIGDDQVHSWTFAPGLDHLVVTPLLSDGSPDLSAQQTVVLPDGESQAVEVSPWWGADDVQICVEARSGVPTGVDFVEVSQE